jgi:hypothetical protein
MAVSTSIIFGIVKHYFSSSNSSMQKEEYGNGSRKSPAEKPVRANCCISRACFCSTTGTAMSNALQAVSNPSERAASALHGNTISITILFRLYRAVHSLVCSNGFASFLKTFCFPPEPKRTRGHFFIITEDPGLTIQGMHRRICRFESNEQICRYVLCSRLRMI